MDLCVNNLILPTGRVWDEADYVVPPAENGAFFITTNVLITSNQTQVGWPVPVLNYNIFTYFIYLHGW